MKQAKFPPGWDEDKVQRTLAHYETQSEDEAVAEDEAAYESSTDTFIEVPNELVPAVRELIAKHKKQSPSPPRQTAREFEYRFDYSLAKPNPYARGTSRSRNR